MLACQVDSPRRVELATSPIQGRLEKLLRRKNNFPDECRSHLKELHVSDRMSLRGIPSDTQQWFNLSEV
jgi:hypothetical protein